MLAKQAGRDDECRPRLAVCPWSATITKSPCLTVSSGRCLLRPVARRGPLPRAGHGAAPETAAGIARRTLTVQKIDHKSPRPSTGVPVSAIRAPAFSALAARVCLAPRSPPAPRPGSPAARPTRSARVCAADLRGPVRQAGTAAAGRFWLAAAAPAAATGPGWSCRAPRRRPGTPRARAPTANAATAHDRPRDAAAPRRCRGQMPRLDTPRRRRLGHCWRVLGDFANEVTLRREAKA